LGLVMLPFIILAYWIIAKAERYFVEKDYQRFKEEKRKRG